MIELRWVIDNLNPPYLQYRIASTGDWSKWITVPTVVNQQNAYCPTLGSTVSTPNPFISAS